MKFPLSPLLVAVMLAGCSTSSNFYQLNVPGPSGTVRTLPKTVVGIAEVDVADYLDQPQMVTRLDEEMLHINETERWAGALDKNIQQALRTSLARRLPRYAFVTRPYDEPLDEAYRLYIHVDRFDGDINGTVRFEGRWSLVRIQDNTTVLSQEIRRRAASESGFPSIVKTQAKLVDSVAEDIANSLRSKI